MTKRWAKCKHTEELSISASVQGGIVMRPVPARHGARNRGRCASLLPMTRRLLLPSSGKPRQPRRAGPRGMRAKSADLGADDRVVAGSAAIKEGAASTRALFGGTFDDPPLHETTADNPSIRTPPPPAGGPKRLEPRPPEAAQHAAPGFGCKSVPHAFSGELPDTPRAQPGSGGKHPTCAESPHRASGQQNKKEEQKGERVKYKVTGGGDDMREHGDAVVFTVS